MSNWSSGDEINTDGSVVGRLGMIPATYTIWKNGSYYEAVDAWGKIAYGGSGNAGGASGTDCEAVIQAAFDVLTSGGKIHFQRLASGAYTVEKLDVPAGAGTNGFIIEGEGRKTVIRCDTSTTYLMDVDEAVSPFVLRNIVLDGNDLATSTLDLSRSSTSPKHALLDNVRISAGVTQNVLATNREEIVMRSCYLTGNGTTDYNIYTSDANGWMVLCNRTVLDEADTASVYIAGAGSNTNYLFASDTEFATAAGATAAIDMGIRSVARLSNCWFETIGVTAVNGVNNTPRPVLEASNTYFQGGIAGTFGRVNLDGGTVTVSAGNAINITALTNALRGNFAVASGSVAITGTHDFWDYTNATRMCNLSHIVEHHTASDTLTDSESGSVHTNLGASGTVTLTLPQDAVAGTTFEFVVMAAQALRIDPGAAGAIYWNGAKQTDDLYIWADDEGESVKLVCDGNNDWVAMYTMGTWTLEV